jgi:hypothetical protein
MTTISVSVAWTAACQSSIRQFPTPMDCDSNSPTRRRRPSAALPAASQTSISRLDLLSGVFAGQGPKLAMRFDQRMMRLDPPSIGSALANVRNVSFSLGWGTKRDLQRGKLSKARTPM